MGDERVNDARIVQLDPQPTLAVRFERPMAAVDVGALMDAAMQRLGAVLARASAAPAGPPYARYHAWGGDAADIEIGFPLAAPLGQLRDLADARAGRGGGPRALGVLRRQPRRGRGRRRPAHGAAVAGRGEVSRT